MKECLQIDCVDVLKERRYCKVYLEDKMIDEIHYTEDGLPLEYTWSAYNYAVHLAWLEYCKVSKITKKHWNIPIKWNIDFNKLGVDPKGDYRELIWDIPKTVELHEMN